MANMDLLFNSEELFRECGGLGWRRSYDESSGLIKLVKAFTKGKSRQRVFVTYRIYKNGGTSYKEVWMRTEDVMVPEVNRLVDDINKSCLEFEDRLVLNKLTELFKK